MIAIVSRSSAAHRARSRVNSAAKDSARAKIAHAVAASRARFCRLYHVERLTPSASHGCLAGRLGPIPCARRQRSERKRAFSRRSSSVCFVRNIFADFRVKKSPRIRVTPPQGAEHPSRCKGNAPEPSMSFFKSFFIGGLCHVSKRSPGRIRDFLLGREQNAMATVDQTSIRGLNTA